MILIANNYRVKMQIDEIEFSKRQQKYIIINVQNVKMIEIKKSFEIEMNFLVCS